MAESRGFALMITVLLLAFLVLLLVSLASLTRVETQVAGNSQSLAKARQNALFALNLALGELQRTTGPDQRTTARADLGIATPVSRQWVAAYGYGANPSAAPIPGGHPALPRRLNWLVSGNESTPFTASSAAAAPDFGLITANAAPLFSPMDPVTGLTADPDPLNTAAYTINNLPAVLLVGKATVDTSTLPLAQANAVVAPLRTVTTDQVPGLSGAQAVGRYAWWVGDQGAKARVNLVDPFKPVSGPDGYDAAQLSAQRPDITKITNLEGMPSAGIDRVLALNQAAFLPSAPATMNARMKTRYHDVTAFSSGVLADTRRGGLKRDLSFLFGQTSLTNFRAALNATYPVATPAAPALANYGSPLISSATSPWAATLTPVSLANSSTWEQLWSFGRLATDGVVTATTATVRPMTAVQYGLSPMLIHYRTSFGTKHLVGNTREYHMRMLVALANPYAFELNSPQVVEPAFTGALAFAPNENRYYMLAAADSGDLSVVPEFVKEFETTPGTWTQGGKMFDIDRLSARVSEAPLSHARIMVRDTSGALPVGRARAYTLDTDLIRIDGLGGLVDTTRYPLLPGVRSSRSVKLRSEAITEWGSRYGLAFRGTAGSLTNRIRLFLLNQSAAYPAGGERDPIQTGLLSVSYGFNVVATPEGKGFVVRSLPTLPPVMPDVVPKWEDSSDSDGGKSGFYGYRMSFGDAPAVTSPFTAWHDFNPRAPVLSTSLGYPAEPVVQCGFVPIDPGHSWVDDLNYDTTTNLIRWGGGDQYENIFFDLPRPSIGVYSLGFLQHFNVGGHFADASAAASGYSPAGSISKSDNPSGIMFAPNDRFTPHAYAPAYAIGNSHAAPLIPRTAVKSDTLNFIDHAYLFNDILWDGFTTTTQEYPAVAGPVDFATTQRTVNKRYSAFRSGTASTEATPTALSAAKQLLVSGAFNVNSTSVEAWTALLCSLAGVSHNDTAASPLEAGFPRTLKQAGEKKKNPVVGDAEYWSGVRELDAIAATSELRKLAQRIVVEVKARGPFLSLSDFVNRRLASDTTGLRGTLQAAIDEVQADGATGTNTLNAATPAGRNAVTTGLADPAHRAADLQAGPPGWVLQGDLLQALGPVISARSDTFTVRTYGEVLDPVNSTSTTPVVLGRAWCEAVVQRMPDYLETADDATRRPDELTSTANRTHGRRYQVVSFRWLQPDDL